MPTVPSRLAERGGRGRQHDARHARPRGGPHRELGAAHVRVEQRGGVLRAERVDARDVVEQLAARHPGGERVLVEDVAARDARPAGGERPLGGVRAGERHDLVAALDEPGGERAADQPAAPGQEDAAHGLVPPCVSAGIARTR